MLVKGYYYSDAIVKDEKEGCIPYRLNYRNGKLRTAYDWKESGVYESKEGYMIRKEEADRLVKEYGLTEYHYRAVVVADNKILDRVFIDEQSAKTFIREEVEKLFMKGEYEIITRIEEQ